MRYFPLVIIVGLSVFCQSACTSDNDSTNVSTDSQQVESPAETTTEEIEPVSLSVLDTSSTPPSKTEVEVEVEKVVEEKTKAIPVAPRLRPKASTSEKEYNFGFIDEGQKIEHTFTIRNSGKALLEIKDVESACGCTVAKLSSRKIKPGESANMQTVFDSNNKFGSQRKTITLYTNGGNITYALVGVVRPKGFQSEKPAKDTSGI